MKKKLIPVFVILLVIVIILFLAIFERSKNSKNSELNLGIKSETEVSDKIVDNKSFCKVGAFVRMAGMEYKVTGIENYNFDGENIDLCCSETEQLGEKMKVCADSSEKYTVMWKNNNITGKMVKFVETYKKGNQFCQKMFDNNEVLISESCQ